MIIIATRDNPPKIDRKNVMESAGRLISLAKSAVPPKRMTQMLICKRPLFTDVIAFLPFFKETRISIQLHHKLVQI